MSASIFDDKSIKPDTKKFNEELGESRLLFENICGFIKSNYGHLETEWKHYGKKSGWILKMLNKNKNLMFVIPAQKYFKVSFTFGEKAYQEIINGNYPDFLKKEMISANKYAEGRTIRLEIKNSEDSQVVMNLIKLKLVV